MNQIESLGPRGWAFSHNITVAADFKVNEKRIWATYDPLLPGGDPDLPGWHVVGNLDDNPVPEITLLANLALSLNFGGER